MTQNKAQIIRTIQRMIFASGGSYADRYVGTSANPNERLFNHGVVADYPWQIKIQASSSHIAREIEDYFIDVLKTDVGPGRGDENVTWVYAYKKGPGTKP